MCQAVDLEKALLQRLDLVNRRSQNPGMALFSLIKDEKRPQEKFAEFVAAALSNLNQIRNKGGFRPSARDGGSLTGRFMRLVSKTHPDGLESCAKAIVSALQIPDDDVPKVNESLAAIILRSVNPIQSPVNRFARNVLVTIYAACQFVTASAHADDYPAYPIVFLRSVSHDLRKTMYEMTVRIDALPPLS